MAEQRMPYDRDAEQAVIAFSLIFNDFVSESGLLPMHFHDPDHQAIWRETIQAVQNTDGPVTDWNLRGIDGVNWEYVSALTARFAGIDRASLSGCTERIVETWRKRGLIRVAQKCVNDGLGDATADDLLAEMERAVFDAALSRKSGIRPWKEAVLEADREFRRMHADQSKTWGIPTGLIALDKLTGGFQGGELIVIAGRPGEGKSALALKLVDAASRTGKRVAFHCLEMTAAANAKRHISQISGIEHFRIRNGHVRTDEFWSYESAQAEAACLPIFCNDEARQTVTSIAADTYKHKPDCVVIDYLQIMEPDMADSKGGRVTRDRELGNMTRRLKALSKRSRIPVIILSQLSREAAKRESGEPQLSDLRESGSIENDADTVIFLYQDTRGKLSDDERYLKIAKQRNGPPGRIVVHWTADLLRFDNAEQREDAVNE